MAWQRRCPRLIQRCATIAVHVLANGHVAASSPANGLCASTHIPLGFLILFAHIRFAASCGQSFSVTQEGAPLPYLMSSAAFAPTEHVLSLDAAFPAMDVSWRILFLFHRYTAKPYH